jgi:hypothetical protein
MKAVIPQGSQCERTKYGVVRIERGEVMAACENPRCTCHLDHRGRPRWDNRKILGVYLNDKPLILVSDTTDRSVWRYRHRIVVKVDRYGLQSRTEAKVFKVVKPKHRKYFAATLHAGVGFTIQAFVHLQKQEWKSGYDGGVADQHILRMIREYNLSDINEYPGRQWGYTHQGQPVIHDYGITADSY